MHKKLSAKRQASQLRERWTLRWHSRRSSSSKASSWSSIIFMIVLKVNILLTCGSVRCVFTRKRVIRIPRTPPAPSFFLATPKLVNPKPKSNQPGCVVTAAKLRYETRAVTGFVSLSLRGICGPAFGLEISRKWLKGCGWPSIFDCSYILIV